MIRIIRPLLVAAAAVALGACSNLVSFDVQQQGSTTVQGGGLVGQVLDVFPPMQGFNQFDLSQSQEFENHDARKDHVSSAKLTSFTLQITAPNDQDFGFLDSIEFYAEANGTQVRVAHKSNISQLGLKAPNPTLQLDLDGAELAPFVKADKMSITATVNGRQPTHDTTILGTATFHIEAGL